MAFGIGGKAAPGGGKRRAFGDAGQHIMKAPPIGGRVKRRVAGDQRHPIGHRAQPRQPPPVTPAARHHRGEPGPARRGGGEIAEPRHRAIGWRHHNEQLVLQMAEQVVEPQDAIALFGAAVAERQQPAQPAPAVPIGGIGDDVGRAIGKGQPRADNQLEADIGRAPGLAQFIDGLAQRDMGAHDAGDGVAIGDADAGMAQRDGRRHHVGGR